MGEIKQNKKRAKEPESSTWANLVTFLQDLISSSLIYECASLFLACACLFCVLFLSYSNFRWPSDKNLIIIVIHSLQNHPLALQPRQVWETGPIAVFS